jgi:heme exporter protein A
LGIEEKETQASMTTDYAIQVAELSKSFGATKALDNISFDLPQQAFLLVIGPNGAGKSTLLKLLSTLLAPSSGSAEVLGLNLKEQAEDIRSRIGVISHRSMLFLGLTAYENLVFYARLYGIENPAKRVDELLDLVELSSRKHDVVRSFSRGMTQRMAIARALVNDPELLLLDEPYTGLDPRAVAIFDELLARIRPGKSFLMISHELEHSLAHASHLLLLAEGKQLLFDEATSFSTESITSLYNQLVFGGRQ